MHLRRIRKRETHKWRRHHRHAHTYGPVCVSGGEGDDYGLRATQACVMRTRMRPYGSVCVSGGEGDDYARRLIHSSIRQKRKGRSRNPPSAYRRLQRQYLYVCTSKSSKLSTCRQLHLHFYSPCSSAGVTMCTFVLVKQVN
jgi:hypothetical protein